jgi:hypothetical protein
MAMGATQVLAAAPALVAAAAAGAMELVAAEG